MYHKFGIRWFIERFPCFLPLGVTTLTWVESLAIPTCLHLWFPVLEWLHAWLLPLLALSQWRMCALCNTALWVQHRSVAELVECRGLGLSVERNARRCE